MVKAVFLDRDGVINYLVQHDDVFTAPWNFHEFVLMPRVQESIDKLKNAGYKTLVITNQPDFLDGKLNFATLQRINSVLTDDLGIDEVYCALDRNNIGYKPDNSLIEFAIKAHGIDRSSSFLIGDRWKDIVPAHNSGLRSFFVGTTYTCQDKRYTHIKPNYTCTDLNEATNIILKEFTI